MFSAISPFVLGTLASIAGQYTRDLSEQQRTEILDCTARVFDNWKDAQADHDGCVTVKWETFTNRPSVALGLLAVTEDRRVPIGQLQPWECAGSTVRNAPDLLLFLWGSGYAPAKSMVASYGLSETLAVLIDRDKADLTLETLATAAMILFIGERANAQAFSSLLDRTASAADTGQRVRSGARKGGLHKGGLDPQKRTARNAALAREFADAKKVNPQLTNTGAASHIAKLHSLSARTIQRAAKEHGVWEEEP